MLDADAAGVLPSLPIMPSAVFVSSPAPDVLDVLPIGYGVESDAVGAGVLDAAPAPAVLDVLSVGYGVKPDVGAGVLDVDAAGVLEVLLVAYGVELVVVYDVVGVGVLDVDAAGVLEVLLAGYGVELVVGYGVVVVVGSELVVVVRQTPPSHLQKGEHPSPETVLPSSHSSSTKPGLRELFDGHTGKITVDAL